MANNFFSEQDEALKWKVEILNVARMKLREERTSVTRGC